MASLLTGCMRCWPTANGCVMEFWFEDQKIVHNFMTLCCECMHMLDILALLWFCNGNGNNSIRVLNRVQGKVWGDIMMPRGMFFTRGVCFYSQRGGFIPPKGWF